jgi:hypothetical protein
MKGAAGPDDHLDQCLANIKCNQGHTKWKFLKVDLTIKETHTFLLPRNLLVYISTLWWKFGIGREKN